MELSTERLVLRPWKEADAEDLYEYAQDPQVGPAAGWAPHKSVEESREIIRTVFSAPEMYAICLKGGDDGGRPVGSVGLLFGKDSDIAGLSGKEAEIGYWIGVPFQGRGLTGEAVHILMKHAFEDLGIETLWCGFFPENARSRRVQAKCGFEYRYTAKDKPWPLIGAVRDEVITAITKEQWDFASLFFDCFRKSLAAGSDGVSQADGTAGEGGIEQELRRREIALAGESQACRGRMYRPCAIGCVNDGVLKEMRRQFHECGDSLDAQYRKYGHSEYFFAEVIEPGRVYEMGYPRCFCPLVNAGFSTVPSHCECSRQSILYVLQDQIGRAHV